MIHKEASGNLVGGEMLWNKEEEKVPRTQLCLEPNSQ